ncbi:ATP-dependent zinc metalloprotease YME1 homolog isoform X3 [Rhopalosiphum maidis]|uniref:ATP-dependent zinc metalloprotease YME1 homolog isoform X3 n=1 Tax=Rhopalosiphum maidis TaxID=43146 RepID=UPI000EFF52EF|nr:ATP-dependent zinc metalloprotease YME1 homolog isoform X3 [Rhopalosiphum maidis]
MFTLGFAIPTQVAAAFPLRITIQGQKSKLKQNKIDVKNKTIEDILPDYAKSLLDNIPVEKVDEYLMNRPTYTVHCKIKKHQNIVRLLQKTVNKKFGLKCHHTMDNINNHILIVSNTRDSSAKHFLHRPRPYFTDVQFRSFKTERISSKENDEKMINRLREMLLLPKGSDLKDQLKNENLNKEELDRLKISFAEGYLVAKDQKGNTTKSQKWWKIVQSSLIVGLLVSSLISIFVILTGTMFKIQLTNQVEVNSEEITVTFNDVKGVDEAKQELRDIVEFLKNPTKFSSLGGKLPKGVLLVGPPGTGKTLLARAVAGEAGVPFFHAAGSEFDEILVGQGARRIRDLFKAAKEKSPCVVFIDEIDSVGAKRTNSVLHPYANQTINQLLTEMDGFHQNQNIIVLGATNRREDLDRALLRPGRFDIEVDVPLPDYAGRKQIINLYLKKILSKDIDVDLLARGTSGFTGADIENMVNQAAVKAASDGAKTVSMKYLEISRDKILMGPEKKTKIPDEEANTITAYHEGGHAIVAYFTKDSHPLHKVTIMPRGSSLGHTAYIPAKEEYHVTKSRMLALMDTMMGGRAAEELIFGPDKVTTGASNDLKQATNIATRMVKELGMSDKVGLRTHESQSNEIMSFNDLSPATNELIDNEIKRIMQESYERAKSILNVHHKEHKLLAEALLKYETLDAEDVKALLSKKA